MLNSWIILLIVLAPPGSAGSSGEAAAPEFPAPPEECRDNSPEPCPCYDEKVVVTAARGPTELRGVAASVSVLDEADIAPVPGNTIADVLVTIPGLHLFSQWGNPYDFGLDGRGFTGGGQSSYVLLLVDGIPVNNLDSGLVDWNLVPLENVENIEMVRGPTSTLYGDVGLAGVVQILTRTPAQHPGSWATFAGGSHGQKEAGLGHAAAGDRFSYDISAWGREFGGERDNSSWTNGNLSAAAWVDLADRTQLKVSALYQRQKMDYPGALPKKLAAQYPLQSGFTWDGRDQGRLIVSAMVSHESAEGHLFTGHLSHNTRSGEQTLSFPLEIQTDTDITLLIDTQRQEANTAGTLALGQYTFRAGAGDRRHQIVVGTELRHDSLESRYWLVDPQPGDAALASDGTGSRDAVALFAQDLVRLSETIALQFGVRFDYLRDSFKEHVAAAGTSSASSRGWAPQAGFTWSYSRSGTLRAQASAGFRSPTLEQRFDQRRSFGISTSNPGLGPQKAYSVSAGINQVFAGGRAIVDVALYSIEVREEIAFDPATFRLVNEERSRHRGLELSLQGQLAAKLQGFLSYAYTEASYLSGGRSDLQIPLVPLHGGSMGLTGPLGRRLEWSVFARLAGPQKLDDANRITLGSLVLLDAQLNLPIRQAIFTLAATNLVDTHDPLGGYVLPRFAPEDAVPLPPSIWVYPARGRALRAALTWRWGKGTALPES